MTIHLPAAASAETVEKLARIVGKDGLSISPLSRILYSRDMYPVALMHQAEGVTGHYPQVVVWPKKVPEVVRVLKLARSLRLPVIPFGAGSGVCGGTIPVRGGIILDLKKMNRVLEVSGEDMSFTAEAGIMGQTLEMELNRRGFTMGHFPSSIYCSTLGGWVAARSAGQLSSKYGKIEDMVLGLEVVMPSGDILDTLGSPMGTAGPDWNQLVIGSEGTLGVVTKVCCRLNPLPATRRFASFNFPGLEAGIRAMRMMMRNGLRPAALRLYDELDTMLVGTKGDGENTGAGLFDYLPWERLETRLRTLAPGLINRAQRFVGRWAEVANKLEGLNRDGCLMILMFEGEDAAAPFEYENALKICDQLGGKNRGPEPAINWYKNRYHVSYKMSKVFYYGAFVDTVEVAATWQKVEALYARVRDAIRNQAFVMAHFSHAYPEGCSIYFTFISAAADSRKAEKKHKEVWRRAMEATLHVGGTISHHHGVGLSKGRYLVEEMGDMMRVLRCVKEAADPEDILNPGKMGL